ncbi:MAG: CynX/NimT family MFS transporter, partial [Nitrospinota bacterium]
MRGSWGALALLSGQSFFMMSLPLCVPPLLGAIKGEMGLSYGQAGFLVSAPILMLGVFALPGGLLADRLGPRRAVGLAVSIMVVGSFLRGVAGSYLSLLIYTLIFGSGIGLAFPSMPKAVRGWFPREMLGRATSLYTISMAFGAALGLALTRAFFLPLTGSWQGSFFLWSAMGALPAVLWWFLAEERSSEGEKEGVEPAGGIGSPSSRMKVWRSGRVWLAAWLFYVTSVVFYTITGWFPIYWSGRGMSPAWADLITSLVPLTGLISIFAVPMLSDRVGLRKPFLLSAFALMGGATLAVPFSSLGMGLPLAIALGLGQHAGWVLCLTLSAEIVAPEHVGRASGLIFFIGYLGGLAGPWLAGILRDATGSFHAGFLFVVANCILACILVILLPETGPA